MFKYFINLIYSKLLSFKKFINLYLKDFWISSKTATRNFYFYVFDNLFKDKSNFQNKSLILLDKLTLQNKASYKTIEFNILIDQVYFEHYLLVDFNYIVEKQNFTGCTFKLVNISKNLPVSVIIPIYQIFLKIHDEIFPSLKLEKFINIIIEIWIYDSTINSSFKKILLSKNYDKQYFVDNLQLIRNLTLFNLFKLSNYYKINYIILLKINVF